MTSSRNDAHPSTHSLHVSRNIFMRSLHSILYRGVCRPFRHCTPRHDTESDVRQDSSQARRVPGHQRFPLYPFRDPSDFVPQAAALASEYTSDEKDDHHRDPQDGDQGDLDWSVSVKRNNFVLYLYRDTHSRSGLCQCKAYSAILNVELGVVLGSEMLTVIICPTQTFQEKSFHT